MDGQRFDDLTKKLAAGTSRRGLFKVLAGGVAAGLTTLRSDGADAARPPRQSNGESCARAADCASFQCVDGVCCDTACAGQCESCATGACLPVRGVPVGDRPACPGSGACQTSCDGVTGSICAAVPGPETSCGAPTCADGLLTTYACGGNGTCAATTERCGLAGCTADKTACASGCASDADCAGDAFCGDGVCQGDGPLGAPCAGDDHCQSGICAQGVCCVSTCPGQCQACNLPGTEGFCAVRADGDSCDGGACCDGACVDRQSDLEHCGACDHACPGILNGSSVCTDGACILVAACCAAADCDDGDLCTDDSCDDAGVCQHTPKSCGQLNYCDPATGDCTPCGLRDRPCCPPDDYCGGVLISCSPEGMCEPCGSNGQPCCAPDPPFRKEPCRDGSPCQADGTCRYCGGLDAPCCEPDDFCAFPLECKSSGMCGFSGI